MRDAGGAVSAHEGHARVRQGRRRRDQREDVGIIMAVIAQSLSDGVDLVIGTFGEQRADRAVDQAADQRFLFRRAAFALEEAAGDAAGRRIFFLVMDGQGKEVLAFLDLLGGGDGRSEEHTSELQSLMRISYAVFCLKKKKQQSLHSNYNK